MFSLLFEHLNPLKTHPERIAKAGKKMVNDLNNEGVEFPLSKKCFGDIGMKSNICINAFYYENGLVYPIDVSGQDFKSCMDLLLIGDENKSHYVYIKDFNRFMSNKIMCINKKHFRRYFLQCCRSGKVLTEHKEVFLKINDKL